MTRTRYTITFCRPNSDPMFDSLRQFVCYDTSAKNAIKRLEDEWPDAIVIDVLTKVVTAI